MMRAAALGLVALVTIIPSQAIAEPLNRMDESRLRHVLGTNPDDHVAMARLARHYADSGRRVRAERLYRGLMSLDDVTLEVQGGATASSHRLAEGALKRLARPAPVRLGSR